MRPSLRTQPGWLFPLGQGFFTQRRWYWAHVCGWHTDVCQMAPWNYQSRTGTLMNAHRSK
jgi:hypothetical protein